METEQLKGSAVQPHHPVLAQLDLTNGMHTAAAANQAQIQHLQQLFDDKCTKHDEKLQHVDELRTSHTTGAAAILKLRNEELPK